MKKMIFTAALCLVICAGLGGCGTSEEKQAFDTTAPRSETTTAQQETTTTAVETVEPDETEETLPEGDVTSEERMIPVTYDGSFECDGITIKTIADVFRAAGDSPYTGSSGNQFICLIDKEGVCARFIANMPADISDQLYELDIFDDDYDTKKLELVKDLEIARVDDLYGGMLSQDELDKYIGKTAADLVADGFIKTGWTVYDTEGQFSFENGYYEYTVEFNEPLAEGTDYDMEGALDGFTIKSVKYEQVSSGVFNTDDLF